MCYCYSQSDEQSSSTNTTTTTDHTNHESDTDSDSKSKPWLSRMFAAPNSSTGGDPKDPAQTLGGDFNAAKHFDLKNVRHDFNRPAGIAAAPVARIAKTGRKIR